MGSAHGPSGQNFSLRAQIRAEIVQRGVAPVDERERRSVERFVAELDRLSDPFDQDADPVHVTGSGIVAGPRGVLLLRHKRLGIWLQPGGHVDPGETPWAAARRECREETGLDVRFVDPGDPPVLAHVDVHAGGRGHTHLDVRYRFTPVDPHADPRPPAGESQEIAWFSWGEAIELADDGLRGALVAMRPAAP